MKTQSFLLPFFLVAFLLVGCANQAVLPETPRQAIGASYLTISTFANTVGVLRIKDLISAEERDELLGDLEEALALTQSAEMRMLQYEKMETEVGKMRAVLATLAQGSPDLKEKQDLLNAYVDLYDTIKRQSVTDLQDAQLLLEAIEKTLVSLEGAG